MGDFPTCRATGFIPHTDSTPRLHVSNNDVLRRTGLLAASSIVHRRRLGLLGHVARLLMMCQQTRYSMLQSSRRCWAITRLEACWRSTSHYLDSSDPPGHGSTGALGLTADRSVWRQITTVVYGLRQNAHPPGVKSPMWV